jgi:hypothetical protein
VLVACPALAPLRPPCSALSALPVQDMTDPSKINIRIRVEEVEPRSMEVRFCLSSWHWVAEDV